MTHKPPDPNSGVPPPYGFLDCLLNLVFDDVPFNRIVRAY